MLMVIAVCTVLLYLCNHNYRDYDIALRTELKRKEIKDDPKRAMELAAYLTHCKLQPVHLALCLRLAYTVFYKCKNLGLCATFCRRLLELNPGQQVRMEGHCVCCRN